MTRDHTRTAWLRGTRVGDWLLIALLLVGAVAVQVYLARTSTQGATAEVYVDGKLRARIALDHPGITEVEGRLGPVDLQVEANTIRVTAAPCAHKVCMRMGRKGEAGDTIVCVPSHLLVRITGTPLERKVDAITQ